MLADALGLSRKTISKSTHNNSFRELQVNQLQSNLTNKGTSPLLGKASL